MSDWANSRIAPAAIQTKRRDVFDYIIVGAGSAGCVVARRLSEDPSVSVLLLDAGGPEPLPKRDEYELIGSRFDWKYRTEPEPAMNNRRIDWPRGKMFGGSSSMSSMAYLRGNHRDYDHWNYLGNDGWAYKDVLGYFKRSEANSRFNDNFHGNDGPLSVESSTDNSALKQAFFRGAESCGWKADPDWDFNGEVQEGVAGLWQKTLRGGQRQSVSDAFLTPVIDRPNLTVRSFALALSLLWEGARVTGVEYVSAVWDCGGPDIRNFRGSWSVSTVRAESEVVVCAGAVDSPRLLMLSGIGPARELKRHGIPVRVDLPGVGDNLQDHPNITLTWLPTTAAGDVKDRIGTNGMFTHSGEAMQAASPDLQILAFEVVAKPNDIGVKAGPLYFCTAALVRPLSIGSIRLQSADPLAAPVIRANYFQSDQDFRALLQGVDIMSRLTASEPYARLLDHANSPPVPANTNEATQYIREHAATNFHPAGTCRMGRDAAAVVDPALRVYGTEGLRVADASIMPSVVNSITIAACTMIGEKAAALIRGESREQL